MSSPAACAWARLSRTPGKVIAPGGPLVAAALADILDIRIIPAR